MDNEVKVAAVLVTYKRDELLKKCLGRLVNQTYRLFSIVIIDNGGFAETRQVIDSFANTDASIKHIVMEENVGGAGGFKRGIAEAYKTGASLLWIMDDDTIPEVDALYELMVAKTELNSKGYTPGLLASNVRWIDGSSADMNRPRPAYEWNKVSIPGLISISTASFVSLLITTDAVKNVGLPISEFFIWGDDSDYSMRIIEKFGGFFVQNSRVTHEIKTNQGVNILSEKDKNRVPRYFYETRNRLYNTRIHGGRKASLKLWVKNVVMFFRVLGSPYGFLKQSMIVRGSIAALSFRPKIDFVDSEKQ